MATSSTVVDMSGDEKEAMLRAADNSQKKRESRTKLDEPTSGNICTARCGKVCNPHMIKCDKCEQYTHFSCTEIPGYQLQQLMTKGYRKYLCPNCFELNFGMVDPIYDTIPSQASTCEVEVQTELLNIIREVGTQTEPETPIDTVSKEGTTMLEYHLGLAEEEIAKLKEANDQLSNLLFDEKESLMKEIAKLKEANDQLSKSLTEELSAAKEEISRINECCVKEKNSNRQQSTKLKSLEEENDTLERKLIHQGNVIQNMKRNAPKKSTHCDEDVREMERKYVELKKLLEAERNKSTDRNDDEDKENAEEKLRSADLLINDKNALIEELREKISQLEATIGERDAKLTEQQRRFDEAKNPNFDNLVNIENTMKKELKIVEESIRNSFRDEINLAMTQHHIEKEISNTPPQINLKSVMSEARNDEKVELCEKLRRERNFLIHGALEVGKSSDEIKKQDEGYIKDILKRIGVNAAPASITRLGENKDSKHRPIKVTMKSKDDQDKVMKNLSRLKGSKEQFGKISVKEDHTTNEREQIRILNVQAKKLNDDNPEKIFKVRGNSKNGWKILSFQKI